MVWNYLRRWKVIYKGVTDTHNLKEKMNKILLSHTLNKTEDFVVTIRLINSEEFTGY